MSNLSTPPEKVAVDRVRLKVLVVHNRYLGPGGEDEVFASERDLLRSNGHDVVEYVRTNHEIRDYGPWNRAALGLGTVWAWDSAREIRDLLKLEKPHVAHFHNTFPLISPSAYYACQEAGVPVVQTLHNPRLICPAATLYRDGHTCQDCLGKAVPWPAVFHSCYRDSRLQTGVVSTMLVLHRAMKTWGKQVDVYIASTEFFKKMFIEAGIPCEKIAIKPHFVAPDPGPRDERGTYALFIGRLAPEKGVPTLLHAWTQVTKVPLKIRGDGPLLENVRCAAKANRNVIQLLPRLSKQEMMALIKAARFLVWPSEGYYETFGLVAVEAFACGLPVIASRLGAMAEIVDDGRTGLHFTAGDADDLAAKVEWAWSHPPEMQEMGRAARGEYEAKYTAETNYQVLMRIYREVSALKT